MTPADLPTYMREIYAQEIEARGWFSVAAEVRLNNLSSTGEAVLAAMHRVYLDRDEGRSLREAKWQPIETAPKMKTIILFAVTEKENDGKVRNWHMGTGFYHEGWTGADDQYHYSPWNWEGRHLAPWETWPTHWMPIPEPPSSGPSGPSGSSLPLPDRERTAGRDSSMISCDPAPDASRPHAPNGTCKSFTVPTPDIVDKREDRSAREEDSGFSWNGFNVRGDRKSIQAAAEATHSHAIVPELRAMICKLRDELKPRAADVTSTTPPDSSLVTDAEVYVARKAYTASGGQWPGVKHMRAALEAVKSKP